MPEVHAKLSASGASRWLECTKSVSLESEFENKSSLFAREGTVAHSLGELTTKYFLGKISEDDYENARDDLIERTEDGKRFYTGEMQECAVDYAELIKSEYDELMDTTGDAFVELEVRVDFSEWVPEGFGTTDCAIISDGILEIIDLKYGKGHKVYAENNPQLRLYALGCYERYKYIYDIKYVRMMIFQPRLGQPKSSETISIDRLLFWAEDYVKPRAQLAWSGNGSFCPGELTCKFCRAKEKCRARYEHNLSLFDENKDLITVEEAAEVLSKTGDITEWLKDIEKFVLKSLLEGNEVPGWKIVEGRSNRKIVDEETAADKLIKAGAPVNDLYVKSFKTLTALETSFGKKFVCETLGDTIQKPHGAPKLAPASDKRPAYDPEQSVIDAFDD